MQMVQQQQQQHRMTSPPHIIQTKQSAQVPPDPRRGALMEKLPELVESVLDAHLSSLPPVFHGLALVLNFMIVEASKAPGLART